MYADVQSHILTTHHIPKRYLPQFKAPVVEAKSLGYMCSYAALTNPALHSDSASHPHSEPCCASKFFAVTKMVEEYGFEGYVTSITHPLLVFHVISRTLMGSTDPFARGVGSTTIGVLSVR